MRDSSLPCKPPRTLNPDPPQDYLKHPKILKDQVRREIFTTVVSVPFMTLLTTPVFLAEVRGYSKLTEGMDLSTTQGILHEVSLASQFP